MKLAGACWLSLGAIAAHLAGQNAAPALEPDSLERPGVLIREIKLEPGMTVADIGTGIGNMLPMLSRRVGPAGRVFAEDAENDFLAAARDAAQRQNLDNITFIKGTDTDPKLPEGQVDIVFAMDVYHNFSDPEKMLAAFYKALRPAGKLVVVEYYKRASAMPDGKALTRIRLDMADTIKELEANHFHLIEEKEYSKNAQYLLILEKS
jgi:ubiquinone/menaquinone biosynthesis C-methylase UbiE